MAGANMKISERIKHTKIREGYCVVCGEHGPLTFDHVPPKGAISIRRVEQYHILEAIDEKPIKLKGVPSDNGGRFRTVCGKCNGERIGSDNDAEVSRVCRALTSSVKDYFYNFNSPYNLIVTKVDSLKFSRAMIGHILSATSVKECESEPSDSSYFKPLREFVLGDDKALDETHDIYYWFYPFTRHISAKCIGFYNQGHSSILSVLSFFPISFMVTGKGEGIYPSHAHKLNVNSTSLYLDLSSQGFRFSNFPFDGLEGYQFSMFNDSGVIVTYPSAKK